MKRVKKFTREINDHRDDEQCGKLIDGLYDTFVNSISARGFLIGGNNISTVKKYLSPAGVFVILDLTQKSLPMGGWHAVIIVQIEYFDADISDWVKLMEELSCGEVPA